MRIPPSQSHQRIGWHICPCYRKKVRSISFCVACTGIFFSKNFFYERVSKTFKGFVKEFEAAKRKGGGLIGYRYEDFYKKNIKK